MKKKNNKLSELVFILDKSGSMAGKEKDTIGSFNANIKLHKNEDYNVLVTTVLFSDEEIILHDRIDIKEITDIDEKQYKVGGCTALIDALGNTITHIKNIHKYQRKENIPEHTMFIIVTDGLENSSHKYSSDDVKKLVEQQKEIGWEFIFLGANIDAVETAKTISIDKNRAVNFINDNKGIESAYDFTAKVSNRFFKSKANTRLKDEDIMEDRIIVDADYNNRKR